MEFLLPTIFFLLGGLLVFVWSILQTKKMDAKQQETNLEKTRLETELSSTKDQLNKIQESYDTVTHQVRELEKKLASLEGRNQDLIERLDEKASLIKELQHREQDLENQNQEYASVNARLKERQDSLEREMQKEKEIFNQLKEQQKEEFKNLTQTILEEKSQKFTEMNSEKLKQILDPLGTNIEQFKKKVEDVYNEENKDRASLKEQLKQLKELNNQMSEDAKNLVKALKGDSKTQGNWGEVILKRILEKSGLREGYEFETEVHETTDENKRYRPDVVVKLPDEKRMIIDSKVTLTAYEQLVNAETEEEKEAFFKQHVLSVKTHIKGLSEKNYQKLYEVSPDFTLMFIPIQPAFDLAMMREPDLYNEAFDKNIIIVSPTTLLATLSTVHSVWKQEYQSKNAIEIARQSGNMYDKFVGFVDDLEKIGKSIESSSSAYSEAMKKLQSGKGNLVSRAEKLKELGAKASKQIEDKLIEEKQDLFSD